MSEIGDLRAKQSCFEYSKMDGMHWIETYFEDW
jgi:hypothetical protein